jgi:riboflavin kinase/FMN adenylyltransferase
MGVTVWRAVDEVRSTPSVVSIGTFDGVHRGHRVVVGTARDEASRRGLPLTVLTFDPHPMSVVRPGHQPPAVATLRHRVELLGQCGADAVLVLPFTAAVAAMSAAEFVSDVLLGTLKARAVVVGQDFRFGHRAAGDVDALRALAAGAFDVVALSPVGHDGVRWSSTEVRQRVAAGDMPGASAVLGHLFEVEGPVVGGDRRGRELGYPTANVTVAPGMLVPADGVYAGYLRRLSDPTTVLPAAVSVGTNPTFDGAERRVEAYVLGVGDLDLYDQQVAVSFVQQLRGQQRFDAVEQLVAQMEADVAAVTELLRDHSPAEVSSLLDRQY